MEVKRSPALWFYRLIWIPALFVVQVLAVLENILGGRIWPKRWRLRERLGWRWPEPLSGKTIWLHAASLGECKGLWALAESLKELLKELPVSFVLTANTTSGLEFLSKRIASLEDSQRWRAVLAPFDHPAIIGRFLQRFRVQALVLFEVELWPHFISTTRKNGKPVFWVSARLTPKALRYHRLFPKTARTLLGKLSWIQTQSGEEANALRSWGCKSVSVGSDLRGLYYLHSLHNIFQSARKDWTRCLGVAFISLHQEELGAVLPAIKNIDSSNPLFVFPRKMEELRHFQNALMPLGFDLHSQNPDSPRLIVDSFGLVAKFLERCHAAVIGGSFAPYGGHNLWEPLAAGIGMIMGPHYSNQNYLAQKLAAAGLLHIANGPLDGEFLRKSDGDPGPACREFAAQENRILLESLASIRRLVSIDQAATQPATYP